MENSFNELRSEYFKYLFQFWSLHKHESGAIDSQLLREFNCFLKATEQTIEKHPSYETTVEVKINYKVLTAGEIRKHVATLFEPVTDEALRRKKEMLANEKHPLVKSICGFDKLVDKEGRERDWRQVFKMWDDGLKAHSIYMSLSGKKVKAEVAKQMGWFPDNPDAENRCYSSRKVKIYLDLAKRLIKAAGNGTFHDEAVKPLPRT